MACLRGRVVAGNGRWVHASTVAMPVPLGHRGVPGPGPGRPLSNVRESWPKSARSRPAERHRRARGGSQQTCTSGTRFAQNRHGRLSAASSAAVLRRRRSRSWCLLRAIPRSRTRQDDGDGILVHPRDPYVSSAAAGACAGERRLDATETGLGLSVPVSRPLGTT
jgi:hypothetical protein